MRNLTGVHRNTCNDRYIGLDVPDDQAYPAMLARLLKNSVRKESGCLEWTGFKDALGYGKTMFRRKATCVHRLMYVIKKGPLTDEQLVRHTCDNPSCMEPEHLLTGTEFDNTMDSVERQRHFRGSKTHCWRGHLLDNTARVDKDGFRNCVVCQRIRCRIMAGWNEYDAIFTPKLMPGQRATHVVRVAPPSPRKKESSHCTNGHELAGANRYVSPRGYVECRFCRNEARKRFAKKRRAPNPRSGQED